MVLYTITTKYIYRLIIKYKPLNTNQEKLGIYKITYTYMSYITQPLDIRHHPPGATPTPFNPPRAH